MNMQPMMTSALADARISDLRRAAANHQTPDVTPAHHSHTFDAPLPVKRRAGWWLVTLGLRLAVGPTAHSAR